MDAYDCWTNSSWQEQVKKKQPIECRGCRNQKRIGGFITCPYLLNLLDGMRRCKSLLECSNKVDFMTPEEFLKLAQEKFGDKISVNSLSVKKLPDNSPWTQEEIESYPPQAWVPDGRCPVCGADLKGSFVWGLVHGVGGCNDCGAAQFRYYHYIAKGKQPVKVFALVGF